MPTRLELRTSGMPVTVSVRDAKPFKKRAVIRGITTRPVLGCALAALVIQISSAIWWVERFESPNFASAIARNLAEHGTMTCDPWWRLRGNHAAPAAVPLRYFHLPGEVLYLSAWFRWMPGPAQRFAHVPVVVALLACSVYIARHWLGRGPAWCTGLLALMHPFMILHGPVWDDTFLAAALEWLIIAGLVGSTRQSNLAVPIPASLTLMLLAAGSAVTRSSSVLFLIVVGGLIGLAPGLRGRRWMAVSLWLGGLIGLGSWGVRNIMVVGHCELGTSHDGITLLESNYPQALEALWQTGQVERLNETHLAEHFARTGGLSETAANRYFLRAARDEITSHPAAVIGRGLLKGAVSLAGIRPEQALHSPRNLTALIANGILFALAGLGVANLVYRRQLIIGKLNKASRCVLESALTAVAFVLLAQLLLGPVGMRYWISLAPIIWIAAGCGGAGLWSWFATRRRRDE